MAAASLGVMARRACWTRLPSWARTSSGRSWGELGDEEHPHALGADQPDRPLDLVDERLGGAVEQQVGLVEEEHQLGAVQVADFGEGLEQLGQQPHHEGREHPRPVGHVGQFEQGHDPLARGVGAQQVVDVEGGRAEQAGHALLLQLDQLAQQHAQGRLGHPAELGHGLLALVGADELQHLAQVLEVGQEQAGRVGVVEDQAEHARLDVVEVQDLGQQGRPELRHRGPHRHPLGRVAGQRQQLDRGRVRIPGGLELVDAGLHLVAGLARLGHA